MRNRYVLFVLAGVVAAVPACQDITNPVEEIGEEAPAWVAFEAPREVAGPHGSWVPVRYGGIAVRPEEDVDVMLEFGGTATFGDDFSVVTDSGSTELAAGFDASGGSALLDYDPFQEATVDTLWLWIPTTATVGSTLEISMVEATTPSGSAVGTGYLGSWADFAVTVVSAQSEVLTGTYSGMVAGDFGDGSVPSVTIAAGPVTVAGTSYDYVELTCCDAAGASWTTTYTLE